MDIQDFLKAKKQMEEEIGNAISAAIVRFEEQTGYRPDSVVVYLTPIDGIYFANVTIEDGKEKKSVTRIDDGIKGYIISEVKTHVPLY